ncbi:MAG: hypothetical protein BPH43C_53 [Phage 5P_1]|nr:MAG: hypothetical protein BPH43C_53 [Phage 5P_1]
MVTEIGDRWAKAIKKSFIIWVKNANIDDSPPFIRQHFDPSIFIERSFKDAYLYQNKRLKKIATVEFAYDLISPEALRWLELYAGTRVQYITSQTMSLIREVTTQGILKGLTMREHAMLIRNYIGLLPQHMNALERYKQKLMDKGIDVEDVSELINKRKNKLLMWRAETIALTEGHTAANEGLRAANTDAVNRGILDTHKYVRQWFVTPDERLCPRCMQMHKTTASLPSGTFPNGLNGPPLHPRCRCTEILVKI